MPKKHVRVAVTTSPYLSNLSIPAMQEIEQRYDEILPIVSQYPLDSSTFVSYLKVEHLLSFEPVYHWEHDII